MDLRKLKNYLKCNYNEMEKNCYLMFNDYVISDKYSIVCLNSNNGLNIVHSNENNFYYKKLKDYREQFKYLTKPFKEITPNFDEKFYKIDAKYEIDNKRLKEIKNLIKANKFEILTNEVSSFEYIIKIENTKTLEIGYLLPCKVY